MKRICYCYIPEPFTGPHSAQEASFQKGDQRYLNALRRVLPALPQEWTVTTNDKGALLEDILDDYDFFVCNPGIASRSFPSEAFQKKVFYITGFEFASQNVRRLIKVLSALPQK